MQAIASTRAIWKGAISFGLVHIPVELRSATAEMRQKFRMIDRKANSAVGYKTVNKLTGEAVSGDNIVKGIEVGDGEYVTLTKEEIRAALPKATQTIEIEAFLTTHVIPAAYFTKPYHIAPVGKGTKAYELLRQTLEKMDKVGLCRIVINSRQHMAALLPLENGLMLNLLRWSEEVRTMEGLELPTDDIKLSARETQMAEMLVKDLESDWDPEKFHDEFTEQLAAAVKAKDQAGKTVTLQEAGEDSTDKSDSAEVLDLTELLKKSLAHKPATSDAKPPAKGAKVLPLPRPAAKKAAAKKTPAAKVARRK